MEPRLKLTRLATIDL